jgi:hypothetical protein
MQTFDVEWDRTASAKIEFKNKPETQAGEDLIQAAMAKYGLLPTRVMPGLKNKTWWIEVR